MKNCPENNFQDSFVSQRLMGDGCESPLRGGLGAYGLRPRRLLSSSKEYLLHSRITFSYYFFAISPEINENERNSFQARANE